MDGGARFFCHARDDVEEPLFFAFGNRPRVRFVLAFFLKPRDELAPFDLARGRSRELFRTQFVEFHAFVERKPLGHGVKMVLDLLLDIVGHRVFLGHDDRGNPLAGTVGKADNGELFDETRVAVELLELVGIDILAVLVDDHLFRAAYDEEVPPFVETPEVAREEPTVAESFFGSFLVSVISRHHVGPPRSDLADASAIGLVDLDLDSRERLADTS